jgi:hypothetical protein
MHVDSPAHRTRPRPSKPLFFNPYHPVVKANPGGRRSDDRTAPPGGRRRARRGATARPRADGAGRPDPAAPEGPRRRRAPLESGRRHPARGTGPGPRGARSRVPAAGPRAASRRGSGAGALPPARGQPVPGAARGAGLDRRSCAAVLRGVAGPLDLVLAVLVLAGGLGLPRLFHYHCLDCGKTGSPAALEAAHLPPGRRAALRRPAAALPRPPAVGPGRPVALRPC